METAFIRNLQSRTAIPNIDPKSHCSKIHTVATQSSLDAWPPGIRNFWWFRFPALRGYQVGTFADCVKCFHKMHLSDKFCQQNFRHPLNSIKNRLQFGDSAFSLISRIVQRLAHCASWVTMRVWESTLPCWVYRSVEVSVRKTFVGKLIYRSWSEKDFFNKFHSNRSLASRGTIWRGQYHIYHIVKMVNCAPHYDTLQNFST